MDGSLNPGTFDAFFRKGLDFEPASSFAVVIDVQFE